MTDTLGPPHMPPHIILAAMLVCQRLQHARVSTPHWARTTRLLIYNPHVGSTNWGRIQQQTSCRCVPASAGRVRVFDRSKETDTTLCVLAKTGRHSLSGSRRASLPRRDNPVWAWETCPEVEEICSNTALESSLRATPQEAETTGLGPEGRKGGNKFRNEPRVIPMAFGFKPSMVMDRTCHGISYSIADPAHPSKSVAHTPQ